MTPETIPLAPLAMPPIAIRPGTTPPAIAAKPAQGKASPADAASLILFGRDERGRPHASRFAATDAEAVTRSAALMGLHTFAVAEAHLALATGLPAGRLFGSGRAFVPFCSAKMFASLLAAAGLPDTPVPARAAGKAAHAPPPAGAQVGWRRRHG